jgi:hypothetical protein
VELSREHAPADVAFPIHAPASLLVGGKLGIRPDAVYRRRTV